MSARKKKTQKRTEALKLAQEKYAAKTKLIAIRFQENEMDLYEFVRKQENTSGFIKDLIRKSLKNKKSK